MAARKFTVTLPDGTVARRSSVRADYAFAVVVEEPAEARAAEIDRQAERQETQAVRYLTALGAEITRGAWVSGYECVEVGGLFAGSWKVGEEPISDEDALAKVRGYLADAEEIGANYRAKAAAIRAEGRTTYGVLRWSRSRDLATKAASGEFAWCSERGYTVTVVPVD